MKQILYILLVGLCLAGSATAAQPDIYINTTNVMGAICPEVVGGTNFITMHPHYVDNWFSVYNRGTVAYHIYAYDYTGVHDPLYTAGCYGVIEPGQTGLLCNNGSYYFYANYDGMQDFGDVEVLEKNFYQYWFIIVIIILIIIGVYTIYRQVKYK